MDNALLDEETLEHIRKLLRHSDSSFHEQGRILFESMATLASFEQLRSKVFWVPTKDWRPEAIYEFLNQWNPLAKQHSQWLYLMGVHLGIQGHHRARITSGKYKECLLRFDNIESLYLNDSNDHVPAELANFSKLHTLSLDYRFDGVPPNLLSLTQLQHLHIRFQEVNQDILEQLALLSNLRSLSIFTCNPDIRYEDFDIFSNLQELNSNVPLLEDTQISANFKVLNACYESKVLPTTLPKATHLQKFNSRIKHIDINEYRKLPTSLTDLRVSFRILKEATDQISHLTQLQKLTIHWFDEDYSTPEAILELPTSIEELSIENFPFAGIKNLHECQQLKALHINRCWQTWDIFGILPPLQEFSAESTIDNLDEYMLHKALLKPFGRFKYDHYYDRLDIPRKLLCENIHFEVNCKIEALPFGNQAIFLNLHKADNQWQKWSFRYIALSYDATMEELTIVITGTAEWEQWEYFNHQSKVYYYANLTHTLVCSKETFLKMRKATDLTENLISEKFFAISSNGTL